MAVLTRINFPDILPICTISHCSKRGRNMEINVNDRTGGKVRDKRVLVTSKYRINKTKLKRRLWFLGILALVAGFALFNGNIYTYLADREYKKQNYEEAVRLYEKVAGSNAKAQAQLAFMYENGQGSNRPGQGHRVLYILAAEKGNARSMYNLAEFYNDGYYGLLVDYKRHWIFTPNRLKKGMKRL